MPPPAALTIGTFGVSRHAGLVTTASARAAVAFGTQQSFVSSPVVSRSLLLSRSSAIAAHAANARLICAISFSARIGVAASCVASHLFHAMPTTIFLTRVNARVSRISTSPFLAYHYSISPFNATAAYRHLIRHRPPPPHHHLWRHDGHYQASRHNSRCFKCRIGAVA